MPQRSTYYRDLVLSEFPSDFFSQLLPAINNAYAEAYWYCRGRLKKPEAHDLIGHLRRAFVEDAMARVAERFPEVRCGPVQNSAPNYFHRVISAGSVLLVQGHSRSLALRPAKHREEYARSHQGELFEGIDTDAPEVSGITYGELVHAVHPNDQKAPGFIAIKFPAADPDRYVTRVNLLKHTQVVPTERAPEEQVDGVIPMRPRRKAEERSGA